jgi:hypothetical protein
MAGSRTRIVAASIAAFVGLVVLLPAAAWAEGGGGLHLRLSSTSGLRAGQSIDYAATGRALVPGRVAEVWQCDARARLAVGATLNDLNRSCTSLDGRTVLEQGTVTGSVTVQEVFTTHPQEPQPAGAVHCGDRRYDCSMAAVVRTDDPDGTIEALSVVRIDVIPSPVAVGGQGLQDGDGSVQVWVSGAPRARLQIAQCVRFPGVPRDLDSCRLLARVELSGAGRATTEVTIVPSLEVDGTTYDCRRRPCQVTLFDPTGAILGTADIPGSVPYADITLDPSTGLAHGQTIQARIESAIPPFSNYYIALCLASVLEDLLPTAQGCYLYFPVAGPGAQVYDLTVYEVFTPYGGGPEVSCQDDPGGCIIGVGTDVTAAGYAPISFASTADTATPPN